MTSLRIIKASLEVRRYEEEGEEWYVLLVVIGHVISEDYQVVGVDVLELIILGNNSLDVGTGPGERSWINVVSPPLWLQCWNI